MSDISKIDIHKDTENLVFFDDTYGVGNGDIVRLSPEKVTVGKSGRDRDVEIITGASSKVVANYGNKSVKHTDTLRKLDTDKKLKEEHYTLYEKFVEDVK